MPEYICMKRREQAHALQWVKIYQKGTGAKQTYAGSLLREIIDF